MSTPAIVATGLVKRYAGVAVVDGVDLTVERGECFGLLGPNGAGKSTTLRMLLGTTPLDGGRLQVLGEPVPQRARQLRARIGVVPQLDNLDPDFTVRENLLTYASYFGLKRSAARPRVEALLEFAALEARAEASITALSGGMKRRLTLARALVNDPELVVLDEPSTGLDPQARQHIWHKLSALRREGRTLLMTTHYLEEAERLCDRLAIIDRGRVVACDTPSALVRRHLERYVVELRGEAARRWLADRGRTDAARLHTVGETVLLYADDVSAVLELLHRDGLPYLHRPAHLEDVFLHLTGHDLRE